MVKLFKLLIFFGALAFLNKAKEELYYAYKSYFWLETQGKIISSSVEAGSEGDKKIIRYIPKIKYEYIVSNRKRVHDRIRFASEAGKQSEAEKYLKKYPVGKLIQVFYDRGNPEQAVLEPGMTLSAVTDALIGGFLAFVSLILVNIRRFLKKFFAGIFLIQSGGMMMFSQAEKILSGTTEFSSFSSLIINGSGFGLIYSGYILCKPMILNIRNKLISFRQSRSP
ncbi:MAG: DUF3592 domain-containing protein [Candidatus Aureabacteria bacterium]|nr:DUF3592 domain-containing protein [Candidatus Auribacterota bacterium]